jgi:uncharacterized protein (DUF1697 family)
VPQYIALLRGINVGSTRSLKMSLLRQIIGDAGGAKVTTYIQSGNALFSHASRSAAKLEAELERAIEAQTGMKVPVLLRSRHEWDDVVSANPFPGVGGSLLHVLFYRDPLPRGAFDAIDLKALRPETMVARERHIYLHLPNGMGKARLPLELERRGPRGAMGTARNWNTVLKLQQLAASSDATQQ